jgi:L-fuconolactonase
MDILDPELPIIDSHFHLFDLPHIRYMFDEHLADINSGHNVIASIYSETRAFMRADGPAHIKPLGEVEFANGMAAMAASGRYGDYKLAAGIVGHADLTYGSAIGELLDRCIQAAPERYRGIRQVTLDYPDERPFQFIMSGRPPAGILENPNFVDGLKELAKRNLSFDAACYDPSLPQLTKIIDQVPDLQVVINNTGNIVMVDMTAAEKEATLQHWRTNMKEIAKRPNVFCKVGGFGMPTWGFEQHQGEDAYIKLAKQWQPIYDECIEIFGSDRCMYGSNFPPDKRASNYATSINAHKYMLKNYSKAEKEAIFANNAKRIYKLDLA